MLIRCFSGLFLSSVILCSPLCASDEQKEGALCVYLDPNTSIRSVLAINDEFRIPEVSGKRSIRRVMALRRLILERQRSEHAQAPKPEEGRGAIQDVEEDTDARVDVFCTSLIGRQRPIHKMLEEEKGDLAVAAYKALCEECEVFLQSVPIYQRLSVERRIMDQLEEVMRLFVHNKLV